MINSHGNEELRAKRKDAVKAIEKTLSELEAEVEGKRRDAAKAEDSASSTAQSPIVASEPLPVGIAFQEGEVSGPSSQLGLPTPTNGQLPSAHFETPRAAHDPSLERRSVEIEDIGSDWEDGHP